MRRGAGVSDPAAAPAAQVSEEQVACDDTGGTVAVEFTPTVEHCSMATLIGLCIRVKLLRVLPPRFKVGDLDRHAVPAWARLGRV